MKQYDLTSEAFWLSILKPILVVLAIAVLYLWRVWRVWTAPDPDLDLVGAELVFGGAGLILWIAILAYGLRRLHRGDFTIVIEQECLSLPGGDRVEASEIERVVVKPGILHGRIEIMLRSKPPTRGRRITIYPHEYGPDSDLDQELLRFHPKPDLDSAKSK